MKTTKTNDAILIDANRYFTITNGELHRLQAAGIQPTTFHHQEWSQRIISVPGNL